MEKTIRNLLSTELKFKVIIDRPKGFIDKYDNIYPINYGYIEGIIANDSEEQDAYIIEDADIKLNEHDTYIGNLVAIIFRKDDVETKWVISNSTLSLQTIQEQTFFLEQYFDSTIILL